MKRAFCILMIFALSGCDIGSGEKENAPASISSVTIKYPLTSDPDSLLLLLKSLPDDTNKINVILSLAWKMSYGKPDTSLILCKNALVLSEVLGNQKFIANSYHSLGWANYQLGNYSLALENNLKALKLREDLGDKIGMAKSLGNIGSVYHDQGDYPKALDYYFRALKINEDLGKKMGIARTMGNIGNIYSEQNDFQKSLYYYFKALKLKEELGDDVEIASTLGNIGIAYSQKGNNDTALVYFIRALELKKKMGIKSEIENSLGNIGNIYAEEHNSSKALEYYKEALEIGKDIGDKSSVAFWIGNMGLIHIGSMNYRDAYDCFYTALAINDSIGAKDNMKYDYEFLSSLYENSTIPLPDSIGGKVLNMEGMRLRSLYYYKKYTSLRDTLFSEQNKKQLVQKEMNYEFDKKEAATKAENDKREALAKEELKQKETERNYFIGGFALVLLLAGFIFRSYRQKQKANEIISHQKLLVEEKQKEILDSIHYAKRIQKSLLPTEKYITRSLDRLKKDK